MLGRTIGVSDHFCDSMFVFSFLISVLIASLLLPTLHSLGVSSNILVFAYCFSYFTISLGGILIVDCALWAIAKKRFLRLGVQEAAIQGNLNDLVFAISCGSKCKDPQIFALAAGSGHLNIVKYLKEVSRCRWDTSACEKASAGGHSEVLQYLLDNRCPTNERTCEIAATNGHLKCLITAHEHGCRWDARTTIEAFTRKHLDCFQYAVERGCPYPQEYDEAARILQTWWRDCMYRPGSDYVEGIVKPRFYLT